MSISPCLWFDTEGEPAARFYTSVFPNSRIVEISRYNEAGPGEPGTVMTVAFELDGQRFIALNGGPAHAHFTEAISLTVHCRDQSEVDRYWQALSDGGEEGPCGWVKDRFGLSWQVVPDRLPELLTGSDPATAQRVMATMLQMGKIDVDAIEQAAAAPADAGAGVAAD